MAESSISADGLDLFGCTALKLTREALDKLYQYTYREDIDILDYLPNDLQFLGYIEKGQKTAGGRAEWPALWSLVKVKAGLTTLKLDKGKLREETGEGDEGTIQMRSAEDSGESEAVMKFDCDGSLMRFTWL